MTLTENLDNIRKLYAKMTKAVDILEEAQQQLKARNDSDVSYDYAEDVLCRLQTMFNLEDKVNEKPRRLA
jgi:hypothetical protein